MSAKPPLMFLAHRIPYPPNKGDKIRSYHMLEHLCRTFSVHLGAFVDDPLDRQYRAKLEEMCVEVYLEDINPMHRKLRSLAGLLQGVPLTLPYYGTRGMREWVQQTLHRNTLEALVVFSSSMAQFVMSPTRPGMTTIIDFVDVDSAKWTEYAQRHRGPMGIVYRREGRKLLEFERSVASSFDASLFVSEQEANVFKALAPESVARVYAMPNGVDTGYFDPSVKYPDPYGEESPNLVFTGAMDYWANIDAVSWFAEEVFPIVRSRYPSARFHIVGARPTQAVKNLASTSGVCVTGPVADVRPYLAHAELAVAPLRVARGLQNKVLEALAMARPVVATPAAMDGIPATSELRVDPTDDVRQMSEQICQWIGSDERRRVGQLGRQFVMKHFGWAKHLSRMDELLSRFQREAKPAPELAAAASDCVGAAGARR